MTDHAPACNTSRRQQMEPFAFFGAAVGFVVIGLVLVACEALGAFPNAL